MISQSKTITILGSTGSIGQNTIKIIKNNLDQFRVLALVANSNIDLLSRQVREVRPKYAVIADQKQYLGLKNLLSDIDDIKILAGFESILEVAAIKCDLVISAIVGSIGMKPTLAALSAGSSIALANKESLVCGGRFLTEIAQQTKAKIIPIDSEHNAIFQIFENDNLQNIDDIVLTASGGPFWNKDYDFSKVKVADAIKHPNWSMGAKVSVDSATMMNKGLELIEAYYLFPVAIDQLQIVVHPQSIIHGLVNYKDGSTLSMMSYPDMRVPISYALNYPKRMEIKIDKLDLISLAKMEFYAVDNFKFPSPRICLDALKAGSSAVIALNSANEIAVQSFLKEKIAFNQIVDFIKIMLDKTDFERLNSIDDVIDWDIKTKEIAQKLLIKMQN